jgi:acyl-CoA thioesterase
MSVYKVYKMVQIKLRTENWTKMCIFIQAFCQSINPSINQSILYWYRSKDKAEKFMKKIRRHIPNQWMAIERRPVHEKFYYSMSPQDAKRCVWIKTKGKLGEHDVSPSYVVKRLAREISASKLRWEGFKVLEPSKE